jgi:hypothetical protein
MCVGCGLAFVVHLLSFRELFICILALSLVSTFKPRVCISVLSQPGCTETRLQDDNPYCLAHSLKSLNTLNGLNAKPENFSPGAGQVFPAMVSSLFVM